jgi:hypothetical protein
MRWLVILSLSFAHAACTPKASCSTCDASCSTCDAGPECTDYASIIEWTESVCVAQAEPCGQVSGRPCFCVTSWGSVCTDCPIVAGDIDPAPATSGRCEISDWEHDWECRTGLPSGYWACCTPAFPDVCQGDACGVAAGTACCPDQVDDTGALACVDGVWQ